MKADTTHIHVILDAQDGEFADVAEKMIHHVQGDGLTIARLARGMTSGRSSVMIRIDLPNEQVVLAETSLRALCAAADAMRTRARVEGEDV